MNENLRRVNVEHNSNGMGVAGFVLALLGLILCWVPGLNWILWLLGLIFSCIGLGRHPKGLAIAGLVISLLFIVLYIVLFVVIMVILYKS